MPLHVGSRLCGQVAPDQVYEAKISDLQDWIAYTAKGVRTAYFRG
jgi:hypothetical protein